MPEKRPETSATAGRAFPTSVLTLRVLETQARHLRPDQKGRGLWTERRDLEVWVWSWGGARRWGRGLAARRPASGAGRGLEAGRGHLAGAWLPEPGSPLPAPGVRLRNPQNPGSPRLAARRFGSGLATPALAPAAPGGTLENPEAPGNFRPLTSIPSAAWRPPPPPRAHTASGKRPSVPPLDWLPRLSASQDQPRPRR